VFANLLGGLLIVSGIGVLILIRFVKVAAQKRVLLIAAVFDIIVGVIAVGLGTSGVMR
jgi:hypothetical protein